MQNLFLKFTVSFQLDQLSSMLTHIKGELAQLPSGFGVLAERHLDRAAEQYEDAISALRYSVFAQAETLLKDGIMHAYFAYRIVHAARRARPEDSAKERAASEAEERISYLGTKLSELKQAIEYSNCSVSDLAADQVDKAMELYDEAISMFKGGEQLLAKRCAQSGILQLAFASELVRAENAGALPGWNGLANPLTNSPVRKLNELASMIIQVYELSGTPTTEESRALMVMLRKAFSNFNSAIRALAQDNTVYAQALVFSGLTDVNRAQSLIGLQGTDASLTEQWESEPIPGEYVTSLANVELLVADIKKLLERCQERSTERARNRLDALLRSYVAAVNELRAGHKYEAKRWINSARNEAGQVREAIFRSDGSPRFHLS